ncbi:MAG: DUF6338 family protein [Gammaproteobacteria bacterium]
MDWAKSELVSILTFLLPGFVAAAVYYSLTSTGKPNQFERVVQALIFTMIVQAVWAGVVWLLGPTTFIVPEQVNVDLVFPVLVAVPVGVGFAVLTNHDVLHKPLRWIGITRETSYPSEWFHAFSYLNRNSYVVLHLKGERRLFGWPTEWPSGPDSGHFVIEEPEWLTKKEPIVPGTSVLVPVREVEMVEFAPMVPRETTEKDDG